MRKWARVAAVASIFMGTVIGAGFASGQEVYHFFSRFGRYGTVGIVLSSTILAALGAMVMTLAQRYQAISHRSFFHAAVGPRVGRWSDGFITFFLVIFSGVMLAGAGSLTQEMGWTWNAGVIGTGVVAAAVLSFRLSGIRGFNLLVIPLLLGTGVAVAGAGISLPAGCVQPLTSKGWFISALLYTSYNLVLAVPVLASVHLLEKDSKVLRWGGWIGGAGLGISALLFHLALSRSTGLLAGRDLPLLPIVSVFGPWAGKVYAVVLWGELFTTYIASVYGLVQRWGEVYPRRYMARLMMIIITSVLVSRVGFSRLIHNAYPICGWLSLGLIIYMILRSLGFLQKLPKKAVISKLSQGINRQENRKHSVILRKNG